MAGPNEHNISIPWDKGVMTFPREGVPFKHDGEVIGHSFINPDGSVHARITDPEIIEIISRGQMQDFSIGDAPKKLVEEDMMERVDAFEKAVELVQPFVEAHGLVDSTMETFPELSPTIKSTVSAAEQHLEMVLRVADWLLEG